MLRWTHAAELDPRVKLFLLVAVGWLAIAAPTADKLLGLTIISLIIPGFSRVPLFKLLRDMLPLAVLLVTFAMLGAFLDPRQPWIQMGPLHLSRPGVITALFTSWRVLIVLVWAFWFTASTSVRGMSMTLEWLLSPLQRLGVNTATLVLALVIALRFIPELLEEGRLIREAQRLRGYREQKSRPLAAARGLLVIIVPLLTRTWLRTEELSDAVSARGYRKGYSPQRLQTLQLSSLDLVVTAGIVIFGSWALL